MPADALARLIRSMPKAELHLHLDGSVRPETALELARARDLDEGMDLAAMDRRLRAPEVCANQAELLRAFELPIALMQDAEALTRITHELVEDVALDGTRYAEIRWAPALHVARGLDLPGVIRAVVSGARSGMAAVAARGGECEVRLIATAMRSHPPQMSIAVAMEAARFIDDGVTGFDLAGPEEAYPDPLAHRDAFEAARRAGLGITLHAGEWDGPDQVRRALVLAPARIAHGAVAAQDAALMTELAEREVTLDLCPTSNVQAGIFPTLADHPLPRLLRAGVPVTLSTDDRTVSSLTLVREYERAVDVLGLSAAELWRINLHALRAAFLQQDEPLRARLLGEFKGFAEGVPELH